MGLAFRFRTVQVGLPLTNFNAYGVVVHIDELPLVDGWSCVQTEETTQDLKKEVCRQLDRELCRTAADYYKNTTLLRAHDYMNNTSSWASVLVVFTANYVSLDEAEAWTIKALRKIGGRAM